MDDLNKKPMRQAVELRKTALWMLQHDHYTVEDYLKFCRANNLLPF